MVEAEQTAETLAPNDIAGLTVKCFIGGDEFVTEGLARTLGVVVRGEPRNGALERSQAEEDHAAEELLRKERLQDR